MKEDFLAIEKILKEKFNEEVYGFSDNKDILEFRINSEINLKVLTFLYDNIGLGFKFLTDITAVHFPDNKNKELEIVYHLHNFINNIRVRIKVAVPISKPEIFSATSLFLGANWMERETYDFYGVIFKGHPNLIRILNVDELDYFPMRKEYALEDKTRQDKDDQMFGRS